MLGYIPDKVVFHHSAGMSGFTAIRRAHKARPGYVEIGYNLVIERDGTLRYGRPIGTQPAANGRGNNKGTVAVLAIGNNLLASQKWTDAQVSACQRVYDGLRLLFPGIKLLGHRDLKATACPGLSIHKVLQ